jgi:hypothetical protein
MGGLIGIVLQLLATYFPHLTLPSPATATLIATALGGLIGYLAPHTDRASEMINSAMEQLLKNYIAKVVPTGTVREQTLEGHPDGPTRHVDTQA